MGKTAAEIEHDLERQRNALSARISRLEHRVRDDVSGAKQNVADRASHTVDHVGWKAGDAAQKVGSVAGTRVGADTPVAEHPKTMLLGAAAAGLALGLVTGKSSEDKRDEQAEDFKKEWLAEYEKTGSGGKQFSNGKKPAGSSKKDDGGVASELVGSVVQVARGFVTSEAASLLETTIDSMRSGLKSAASTKTGAGRKDVPDSDYAYERAFTPPPQLTPAGPGNRNGQ